MFEKQDILTDRSKPTENKLSSLFALNWGEGAKAHSHYSRKNNYDNECFCSTRLESSSRWQLEFEGGNLLTDCSEGSK